MSSDAMRMNPRCVRNPPSTLQRFVTGSRLDRCLGIPVCLLEATMGRRGVVRVPVTLQDVRSFGARTIQVGFGFDRDALGVGQNL